MRCLAHVERKGGMLPGRCYMVHTVKVITLPPEIANGKKRAPLCGMNRGLMVEGRLTLAKVRA